MAHHQEADRFHAEFAGGFDVLARNVGFGTVRGDAHDARTGAVGRFQVMHGADAGQQQGRDLGVLDGVGHGLDPFEIGMRAEAVVEAGALQAVAVGDFDGIDLGLVERASDLHGLLDAVLVANGVRAVAQGDVGDVELLVRIEGHACSPQADRMRAAMRSAVVLAAEVMMSRLPA